MRNVVLSLSGQPQMQVEVILASAANACPHLYTIRMRYPRPIHGEIMTHRVFGRNARSSRAVPVLTMLKEVRTIPYVPWHWGKNQRGMQASEECDETIEILHDDGRLDEAEMSREEAWLYARDMAADTAEAFMVAGYHKQNPNRLLEPFSWIDTLITATQWDNFLWLRQHGAAEPHLQDLANLVARAIETCYVQNLERDQWHLPYIKDEEWSMYSTEVLQKISAARCARISYKPFDGNPTIEREMERFNHLVSDERVHASPMEHQATPDPQNGSERPELHGNLTDWIQFRKLIPNEVYHGV